MESRTDYTALPRVTLEQMRKHFGFAREYARKSLGHTSADQASREKFAETVNGKNTGLLANKYKFVELLHQLGFTTPKQWLLLGTETLAEKREILNNFPPETVVYCKPVAGTNSSGMYRKAAGEITDAELLILCEPTVLQEAINIQTEFRYVWHRDARGQEWKICFEKKRPSVVGDGKSTLSQLIDAAHLPIRARLITKMRHAHLLREVVPDREHVVLSHTGNPTTGGYEAIPDPRVEKSLSLFMSDIVSQLEQYLNTKLSVLCLDIGVTDVATLNNADASQLRQKLIVFENQFPFSAFWFFSQQKKPVQSLLRFYNSIAQSADKKKGSQ